MNPGSYYRRTVTWFLLLSGIPTLIIPALFILDEYRTGIRHLKEITNQLHRNLTQNSKEGYLTGEVDQYLVPLADSVLANPEVKGVLFRDREDEVLLCMTREGRQCEEAMRGFRTGTGIEMEGRQDLAGKRLYYVSGPVTTWKMSGAEQLFGLQESRTQVDLGTLVLFSAPDQFMQAYPEPNPTSVKEDLFA